MPKLWVQSFGERGRPCRIEAKRRRIVRRGWRPANHIPILLSLGGAGDHPCFAALGRGQAAAVPIRGRLRPFAVAVGLPRNRLTRKHLYIFLHSHVENLSISAKTAKTYGRLFGMIFFWGGFGPTLVAEKQWLRTIKISKKRKSAKKNGK
jgi:hypothetical protein